MACRHKWERARTRIQGRRVVLQEDECAKCGYVRIISDALYETLADALTKPPKANARLRRLLRSK